MRASFFSQHVLLGRYDLQQPVVLIQGLTGQLLLGAELFQEIPPLMNVDGVIS